MPDSSLLIVGAAVLVVVLFFIFQIGGGRHKFLSKPLLTENEIEFFGRLKKALPDYEIFPQVALKAFIKPGASSGSKQFWAELAKIGSKHCDFLICRPGTYEVVAIIELDDRSHDSKKDAERDAMTMAAGFKTLRFESRRKPRTEEIHSAVMRLISPSKT